MSQENVEIMRRVFEEFQAEMERDDPADQRPAGSSTPLHPLAITGTVS
jgi:hypothetical protein